MGLRPCTFIVQEKIAGFSFPDFQPGKLNLWPKVYTCSSYNIWNKERTFGLHSQSYKNL